MGGPRGKLVMSVETGAGLSMIWDRASCGPGLADGSRICTLSPLSFSDVVAVAAQRGKRDCSTFLFIWRQGSPGCLWGRLQSHYVAKNDLELQIPLLLPTRAGITSMHQDTRPLWCWRLNPGPHACWANALPNELHCQTRTRIF